MNSSLILATVFVAFVVGVQCFSVHRPMPHMYQPEPCSASCDEIKTLISLARILDDDEKPKTNTYNPEELILKLVNALVVTSTSQNRLNYDTGYNGGRGSQVSRGHSNGLVNLDLLNPNNPNNVAQLDLGKQSVVGVGLGDTTNGIVGGVLKDLL